MARSTVYTLYKTGRIDPTLTHIWAFRSPSERYTWLTRKASLEFTGNKYWRVGNPIKIPISYETSFEYDYIRIINDAGTQQQREWYAFISARAYISPSVTVLTLDVDYIQTYYFTNQAPFWDASGFIVKATGDSSMLPLPGTASDYPVPQSQTDQFIFDDQQTEYAYILYSTIDPSTVASGSPRYQGIVTDGVYSAACPYVIGLTTATGAGTILNNIVAQFNENGYTEAISAIYAVPPAYISQAYLDGQIRPFDYGALATQTITVTKPSKSGQYDFILSDYDYTYFVLNNGQGETEVYHFYEFNGSPQFGLSLSVTAGCPTLFCYPLNLKYNMADYRQRVMKVTQAISCVFLNDSYKIWLAQTQNSRAAALDGANLAIAQAKEARSKSWAYQFGGMVEGLESQLRPGVTSLMNTVANRLNTNKQYDYTYEGLPAGVTGVPGGGITAAAGSGIDLRQAWKSAKITSTAPADIDISGLYDLGTAYLNNQLGIETRYTYDHAVARAQQSLNELVAGWKDKARVPGTIRGSYAYGDMARLRQYGFMFSVYSPAAEVYTALDQMIGASGYSVNRYGVISDFHQIFDYYQVNSAKIPVNTSVRPEFVRKMMLDLLQRGVYLWYIKDGDISPYIGSPMGLTNPLAT